MSLSLPVAEDTMLARPPLAVVVCQIRYEQNLGVGDGDTALKIHEDLGGRTGAYPVIEPQQLMSAQIEMGPNGLASLGATGFPRRGWRMRSTDSKWIVSVMPDHVSIETNDYTSWKGDFRDRVAALLAAIETHVDPTLLERAGLRYVNQLTDQERTSAGDWTGVVSRELLGPVADSFWSVGIGAFQQQVDLDLGEDIHCVFRQGLIPNPTGGTDGYLLDYDIYQQFPQRFDVGSVMHMLDHFNRSALALFQKSLEPEYLASLRTE